MVQMFRDRMRSDGYGLRGLIVWRQMIFDLIGAAYEERREGVVMTKQMWIGAALAALLLVSLAGGTLLAQSKGEVQIVVSVQEATKSLIGQEATKTFTGTGTEGIGEAVRQAVEQGALDEKAADKIVRSFEGDGSEDVWQYDIGTDGVAEAIRQAVGEGVISQALADDIVRSVDERPAGSNGSVFVLKDTKNFSRSGTDGVVEVRLQTLGEGAVGQEAANEIVRSLEGDGSANAWQYDGGAGGVAEAVRQAVEEGAMSQEVADVILRILGGENAGS